MESSLNDPVDAVAMKRPEDGSSDILKKKKKKKGRYLKEKYFFFPELWEKSSVFIFICTQRETSPKDSNEKNSSMKF